LRAYPPKITVCKDTAIGLIKFISTFDPVQLNKNHLTLKEQTL